MGVYIKGIEMPKGCSDCFYAIRCDACIYKAVLELKDTIYYLGKKPDDCPLVEIDEDVFPKK